MDNAIDGAVIAFPIDRLGIWEVDVDEVTATVWSLSSLAIEARDFIADIIVDQPADPLIDLPRLDEILTRMSLILFSCRDPASAPPSGLIDTRKSVLRIIDSQYSDPRLSCASIAWQISASTRSLHRAFAGTGTTVAGLIMAKRLTGAAMELAHGDPNRTVAAVARAHGFRGADQFTRNFKRHYGTSPAEFRRLLDMHARTGMPLRNS
ncbi:helix-turn-helix transcriptional regulator [Gordonia sp. NPDC003429]